MKAVVPWSARPGDGPNPLGRAARGGFSPSKPAPRGRKPRVWRRERSRPAVRLPVSRLEIAVRWRNRRFHGAICPATPLRATIFCPRIARINMCALSPVLRSAAPRCPSPCVVSLLAKLDSQAEIEGGSWFLRPIAAAPARRWPPALLGLNRRRGCERHPLNVSQRHSLTPPRRPAISRCKLGGYPSSRRALVRRASPAWGGESEDCAGFTCAPRKSLRLYPLY